MSISNKKIVSLFLLLHAIISSAINPNLIDLQSLISFALVSVLLFFIYAIIFIHDLWRTAILGFLAGIYVNFLLVLFFLSSFNLSTEWGRVDGTLGNANYFGYMVNFSIVFYIWIKKSSKMKWPFILDIAIYSISAYHVVLSGSKTNIILLVLIMLVIIAISIYNNGKIRLLRNTILVIILCVLVFIYFQNLLFNLIDQDTDVFRRLSFFGMFLTGEGELGSSDQTRVELVNYSFEHWVDKPIFGHGFDAFTFNSGFNFYSHSNIVENLYNGGLYGFIVFYSMYYFYFKSFKAITKRKLIDKLITILNVNNFFINGNLYCYD